MDVLLGRRHDNGADFWAEQDGRWGKGTGIPPNEVHLAVVGIVPSKVCDEAGPIAICGLLVMASLPARTKRAPEEPRPGTVLRMALGSLERTTGTVEAHLMAR